MIRIDNLTKLYNSGNGIKNINLCIKDSETISLIGPNGAGKSTLIKVICNVLDDYSGSIRYTIAGENKTSKMLKDSVGYMPDYADISEKITAWELMALVNDFKFDGKHKEYLCHMIERYQISNHINKRFNNLSLGMKKKVLLIISMMGTPKLLVLDEPTTGLDTEGILSLKQDIIKLKGQGTCIIISSHILDFLSAVADRHIFLKDGSIAQISERTNLDEVYTNLYL